MLDPESHFYLHEKREGHWVIKVCQPWCEPITLAGAYVSEAAASAALVRNRPRWLNLQDNCHLKLVV